jgi:hypothetical protein
MIPQSYNIQESQTAFTIRNTYFKELLGPTALSTLVTDAHSPLPVATTLL